MQEAYENGIVVQPKSRRSAANESVIWMKQEGRPIDTVWTDIPPINSQAQERLGYPTQKPLALLDRIVRASSEPKTTLCWMPFVVAARRSSRRRI